MEINYGPFETLLELPSGYELTQAKASYLNGFLRIDVPVAAPTPLKRTWPTILGRVRIFPLTGTPVVLKYAARANRL